VCTDQSGQLKGGPNVHGEYGVRVGRLKQGGGAATGEGPRVVDEHVHDAELGDRGGCELGGRVRQGEVGWQDDGLVHQAGGDALQIGVGAGREGYAHARGVEPPRYRCADAAARAGDQRGLAFE
jgi:hypothetical protein